MARRIACLVVVGLSSWVSLVRTQTPQVPASPSSQANLTATFQGRVVSAETGAPLRNARVLASDANGTVPPALTDANGRFAVAVSARSASLSVIKPGYLPATLPPRSGDDVQVRMTKAAAISGRITDAAGDPLIGMTVTASLPADPLRPIATVETDDRGQ